MYQTDRSDYANKTLFTSAVSRPSFALSCGVCGSLPWHTPAGGDQLKKASVVLRKEKPNKSPEKARGDLEPQRCGGPGEENFCCCGSETEVGRCDVVAG